MKKRIKQGSLKLGKIGSTRSSSRFALINGDAQIYVSRIVVRRFASERRSGLNKKLIRLAR